MRIVDLLRSYDGLERIADETPAAVDIRRHVYATNGVAYERLTPASSGEVGPGTIVITALGPDPEEHGDPAAFEGVIRRLRPGGRVLVLLGWEPVELPYHRFLDVLTEHRCQVVQIAMINVGSIHAGAVIEQVDELRPPRNAVGEAVVPPPADGASRLPLEIRIANEWVFGDFAARALRTAAREAAGGVDRRRFDAYRAQSEAEAAQRDKRIRELEAKLAGLTSSTSLLLGRTLVGAARSPGALIRLPRDLVRIWRRRG